MKKTNSEFLDRLDRAVSRHGLDLPQDAPKEVKIAALLAHFESIAVKTNALVWEGETVDGVLDEAIDLLWRWARVGTEDERLRSDTAGFLWDNTRGR